MKILFISNGHGEDAIGAFLAKTMLELEPDLEIEALPIVGRGNVYEKAGVRVVGPRWSPPSGGFTFTSLALFQKDWRDGMRQKTHEQHWAARNAKADVVMIVGDVYALWVTFSFAFREAKPRVFQYQPLVSRYYQDGMNTADKLERSSRVTVDSFVLPERLYMKRVEKVFTRDERSAAWLRELGVPHAKFAGNIMMDLLTPELELQPMLDGRPVLALLPGTRNDYLFSLPIMLETAALLPEFQCFAAFSGNLDTLELPTGWVWTTAKPVDNAARVAKHSSGIEVAMLENAFAALLHAASVVLGTSGTGNEQAVGLGKPVIGFPTTGPQYLEGFAKAQKRLLGAGLTLEQPRPENLARAVQTAHQDQNFREQVKQAGLERMGLPGGAKRIALEILVALRI
jgi:uncharacterized protein (TIGR03492 family)